MLLSSLVGALAFAASVTAAPAAPRAPVYQPATDLSALAKKMPTNTLPPPDGLKLKYVLLGVGTQNYTCGDDGTAEPGTTGALAKLYDIGTTLNKDPAAAQRISTISGLALTRYNVSPKFLERYLLTEGFQEVLGDHFFTKTVPTFSLNKVPTTPYPLAYVTKKAEMDAPGTSCPSPVKWLQLVDNGSSVGGVSSVYRLQTAGGSKPKVCEGQKKAFEVNYAAQYWVFGK